jgi:hypothetical protein
MTSACDQAEWAALGGRSSREGRRSEGSREDREGCSRRPIGIVGGSKEPSAATFPYDPTGAEGGRIGSWQGAEFRHGLSERSAREVEVDGDGVVRLGGASDLVEPQQHDAPRHFGPHLQALACEAASNGCEPDTVAASISPLNAQASTSTKAGKGRPARRMLRKWRGRARTGESGPSLRGGACRLFRPGRATMIEADRAVVKGWRGGQFFADVEEKMEY